ncbi:MAG: CsbD family protein [Thermomicrobiales bacterium]|nr:CsbD family protein [Thermomicrobiales bacterium]
MSDTDQERAEATVDQVKGKAKDAWGGLTGDADTQAEGKLDQLKGKVKEGLADIKDKLDGEPDNR